MGAMASTHRGSSFEINKVFQISENTAKIGQEKFLKILEGWKIPIRISPCLLSGITLIWDKTLDVKDSSHSKDLLATI